MTLPRPADFYHTCYVLSGLSVAQHVYRVKAPAGAAPGLMGYYWEATPYSSPDAVPEDHGCLMVSPSLLLLTLDTNPSAI